MVLNYLKFMKYRRKIPMTKPGYEPRALKWESDALWPTPSEPYSELFDFLAEYLFYDEKIV